MRWIYAIIGVIGGALSLAAAYLVTVFSMLGNVGKLGLLVILAVASAAVLNLVAGFLDPRGPTSRWLLLISAVVWPLLAVSLVVATYLADPSADVAGALNFLAVVSAPALLPLAAWAFARWQFGSVTVAR